MCLFMKIGPLEIPAIRYYMYIICSTNELGDVLAKIVKATGCDLTKKGQVVLARDTRYGLFVHIYHYRILQHTMYYPDQVERD